MKAYGCGTPIRQEIVKSAAKAVDAEYFPEPSPKYRGGDAIIWGLIRGSPELIKQVEKAGNDYWHMDNGYFGRQRFFRITKNANQYVGIDERKPHRFEQIAHKFSMQIRPWQKGSKIILALSTEWLYKFHGLKLDKYVEEMKAEIRKHTDRKVVVRPKNASTPIENDLKDAHALVTYSSCAALDALQFGVPVFTSDKCCAWPLSGSLKDIENPDLPEREPLFWSLAWRMFTPKELERGMWLESSLVTTKENPSLIMSAPIAS